MSAIPEVSPVKEQSESITEMCAQLTQGLSALSTEEDPFAPAAAHPPPQAQQQQQPGQAPSSHRPDHAVAMLHTHTTVTHVNDSELFAGTTSACF